MMLWALDIERALDKDGKPIIPSANTWHDEGLVVYVFALLPKSCGTSLIIINCCSRPEPFDCRISARFPEVQAVLKASLIGI